MFGGSERESIFVVQSRTRFKSGATSEGKRQRGRCLKLLLAGTSYGQTKMLFCAGTEEVNTFLFKLNKLIF